MKNLVLRSALLTVLAVSLGSACNPRNDIDGGALIDSGQRPDSGPDADAGPDTGAGTDSGTLDDGGLALDMKVANWNLEWFGDDAGNGLPDLTLQYNNVLSVMKSAPDVDIWGLEEVVSASEFTNLTAALGGFTGVLSRDVNGGSSYYTNAEQKVALVFRSSKVALNGTPKLILTEKQYDFAGRPPLEVPLRVTGNGKSADVTVIVLHMKAQLSGVDDYNERLAASADLKAYLDASHAGDKVMVVGDWNDDVDTSIYASSPSPYANFVTDSTDYLFPTAELSAAGKGTTVGRSSTIDHQLITSPLFSAYVSGSAIVYDAQNHITGTASVYKATTTDHYPVMSRYRFGGSDGPPPPHGAAGVFINEVMAHETGSAGDYGTEFVELVNGAASTVDLSGWKLSTNAKFFLFPAGTTVAAGKALVVFNTAAGIPAGLTNAISSNGTISLYNNGVTVTLGQADGGTADSVSVSSAQASTAGLSINRSPDGTASGSWVEHNTLSAALASPGKKVNGSDF